MPPRRGRQKAPARQEAPNKCGRPQRKGNMEEKPPFEIVYPDVKEDLVSFSIHTSVVDVHKQVFSSENKEQLSEDIEKFKILFREHGVEFREGSLFCVAVSIFTSTEDAMSFRGKYVRIQGIPEATLDAIGVAAKMCSDYQAQKL
jgi:hypothetical protein